MPRSGRTATSELRVTGSILVVPTTLTDLLALNSSFGNYLTRIAKTTLLLSVLGCSLANAPRNRATLTALREINNPSPATRESILRLIENQQLDLRVIVPALVRKLYDPAAKVRIAAA